MEQRTPDQEVDLMALLARFYKTFRANRLATLLFPALGLIAGVILSTTTGSSVKTSMMIATDLISENELKFLGEQLEKADTIKGLKAEQQRQLTGISSEVKKGEQDDKNIYLQLTAVIKNKAILPVLQNAIVDYINKSEPVVRRRMEKEKFYEEMIKTIDTELNALEDVKNELNNKTKATFLLPSDLFSKTVDLFDRKMIYQAGLTDIKSVHIVKGFGSMTKNEKWPRWAYALIGFGCGLMMLFITLFIKFFNRYYTQFEKDQIN